DRRSPAAVKPPRRVVVSIDMLLFTPRASELALLLSRVSDAHSRERWAVPWELLRGPQGPDDVARAVARRAAAVDPVWVEQMRTFGDDKRHAHAADLSVAYVGVLPAGTPAPIGGAAAWFAVSELPTLAPRQA